MSSAALEGLPSSDGSSSRLPLVLSRQAARHAARSGDLGVVMEGSRVPQRTPSVLTLCPLYTAVLRGCSGLWLLTHFFSRWTDP